MKMKLLHELYATAQYNAPPEEPKRRESNWGFAAAVAAAGAIAIGIMSHVEDTQPVSHPDTEVTREEPSATPSESTLPIPELPPSPTDIPTFEE